MSRRILVIDDEPANVALLERALTEAGYTPVESVTDPLDAIGTFEKFRPDLVLLDLNMPVMDGFAVLTELKRLVAEGEFLPVVVITADTNPKTKRRALAAGATDFLTKPIDLIEATLRAKNLLATRSLHRDLARLNRGLESRVLKRTKELEVAYAREKELTERLRELDRIKDDFLLAVSHEVRTPLAAIVGAALTLQGDWKELEADEIDTLLTILASASQKLESLLSGVLDVDRLRRGLREPLRQETDIAAVVRRVVDATNLRDHPVDVQVQLSHANVDPAQFERIIETLLVNAVQHTPPGTHVNIAVRSHDGGVLVAVDDNGPGIPDRLKGRLFEPFVQGDAVEYTPGLGLGLVLVAQFALLHEGRVWVEDRPGGGAAFRVWLRLSDDPGDED